MHGLQSRNRRWTRDTRWVGTVPWQIQKRAGARRRKFKRASDVETQYGVHPKSSDVLSFYDGSCPLWSRRHDLETDIVSRLYC